MDHVFRVLPQVLRKRGIAEHAEAALVVHRAMRWLEEHLPHLSSFIRVAHLRDGVLSIECTHAIAQQECQEQSEHLKVFLADQCAFAKIQGIRVTRQRR